MGIEWKRPPTYTAGEAIGLGVGVGVIFSIVGVVAAFLKLGISSEAFIGAGQVLLIYLGGGAWAGFVTGVMRKWIVHSAIAVIVGTIAAAPTVVGFVALSGPHPGNVPGSILLSGLFGAVIAYWIQPSHAHE